MSEAVNRLGARHSDRPYQMLTWPGEPAPDPDDAPPPIHHQDRYVDLIDYITWDTHRRWREEQRQYAEVADEEAESTATYGHDDEQPR